MENKTVSNIQGRQFKDYPDVMNIKEMCQLLAISTKTGYELLKEKKIKSLKIGRAYRIPKNFIKEYLRANS